MRFLKNLFAKTPADIPQVFEAPLHPDTPFYVIGDIHGCMPQFETLLEKIFDHSDLGQKAKIICVGDYIDRGEYSADVLRKVQQLSQDDGYDVTCLKGNHEDMLLQFIEDPEQRGARWIRYGGLQTLASFGVGLRRDGANAQTTARDQLLEAMGPELFTWIQTLPCRVVNGNVAVVHAAADPNVEIQNQDEKTLMWGHPDFMKQARTDGVWVVHGHTIVDEAHAELGRIAIDTGAFATGQLTAVCVQTEEVFFF